MAKPAGRCIFCGGFGLSKEHVLPDWLRQIFPRLPTDTHTWDILQDAHTAAPSMRRIRGQGQLGSKKVRVVCKKCNSGWLSTMEDETKGDLSPIVSPGFAHLLSVEAQQQLAAWIAKTTMTAEFLVKEQPAIKQDERERFKERQLPEDHWQIWISSYIGRQWRKGGIFHHGVGLYIPPEPMRVGVRNTQFTVIGLGRLICIAISSTAQGFSMDLGEHLKDATRQLWPPLGRDQMWPSDRSFDDNGVERLCAAFGRALNLTVPKF